MRSIIASLFLAGFPIPAIAFVLTPMTTTFDPSGAGTTRAFQVENTSEEAIPVELTVLTREMDENGRETQIQTPETEQRFTIFPPQIILQPKQKRMVRVTWTGPSELDRELAYRLVAEQLPVEGKKKDDKSGGIINVLLRYVAAIYVKPKSAKPSLKLASVDAIASSPPKLALLFENTGTAHQVLSGISLKAGTTLLESAALPIMNGQNVLAGHKRRFEIAWPSGVEPGNDPQATVKQLQVSFELETP